MPYFPNESEPFLSALVVSTWLVLSVCLPLVVGLDQLSLTFQNQLLWKVLGESFLTEGSVRHLGDGIQAAATFL